MAIRPALDCVCALVGWLVAQSIWPVSWQTFVLMPTSESVSALAQAGSRASVIVVTKAANSRDMGASRCGCEYTLGGSLVESCANACAAVVGCRSDGIKLR